jgi:hypothetical protein
LLSCGFQRRTFPFLGVPELCPDSATSFSQQQLTTTKPQQFSNSLTNQLHSTQLQSQIGQVIHPEADHIENISSNSTSIVGRGPLPSNGCCLVVCFAVVAYQGVYGLHYTPALDVEKRIFKNYAERIQREKDPYEMWILDILKLAWCRSALPVIVFCLFPS